MRILNDERGQVMVLTVFCMAVLIGFLAFAIDVGILLRAKRTLQTAADSAAIAGAAELAFGDWGSAAQADSAQNGVTDGVNGATVVVHNGPSSGPFANNASYVEVIVTQPQPTFFISAFNALSGLGQSFMTLSARAVATPIPTPSCIYTASSISLANGADLSAPTCGIIDEGTGNNALTVVPGATLSALYIAVVGGDSGGGNISPAPITGTSPTGDPLNSRNLQPPAYDPAACLDDPHIAGGSDQSFGAVGNGTICYNGLTVSGSGIKTMNSGIYVINGPMVFNSSGTIQSGPDGVTIYFTPTAGGSFTDLGGNAVQLAPSDSGTYQGILFYQDPGDTQTMSFTSDNTWSLSGIIYAPTANLTITAGLGPSSFSSDFVVNALSFTGNSPFNLTPYAPLEGPTPIATPRLAE
jgi:hypothetical protein